MDIKTPVKALRPAYRKSTVTREDIERFKSAFVTMQSKLDAEALEEHQKNVVRDFLLDAYYKDKYEINIEGRKDLVIHSGPKKSDAIAVIIEAKAAKNQSEMIRKDKLNKKALQELLLYYLRERIDQGNKAVKRLIITNAFEWFIFDENDFEKLFYRSPKLVKEYKIFKESNKDTKHFYDSIAKPFIEGIKDDLDYTYFNLAEYENVITNDDQVDDKKLINLFKLLSPTHLLKQSFANDSNSLNRHFYNELLHIIGLEETKVKNKKVIQRKAEGKRDPASLLENAINILKYETNVSEPKRYEKGLELCITWINRILFLKLLESQLVKYHGGDRSYKFLDFKKIPDFDTLNRLFFQVLAIRPEDRRAKIQEAYKNVPYLNSSLFEVNELEQKTIRISSLEDSEEIPVSTKTVLKNHLGKTENRKLNTLDYLFRFLEAYDFSSEGGEQIQEENKTLINASVLGLIFEKINGYKDGSFFTPGFITMYMCRETIRRSVIQKFKEQTGFDSEEWGDLKNYLARDNYKKEALINYNRIIDSIKICDPAVGSGHFLVSALNEIIAIKSDLDILSDDQGIKPKIKAIVENDELIIQNRDAEETLYEYQYQNEESRATQELLFEQKRSIIENSLFGVDINPNSVKICRLRLWIELLKHAYYTKESKFTDLETLPNIDINIKCGNSLISRFDLDSDLKPALKKSKFSIDGYKAAVKSYKDATDKDQKNEFKQLIQTIKLDFTSEVRSKDKRELSKLEAQFYERFGATLLDVVLTKTQQKKRETEKKKLTQKIETKKAAIAEIQNNQIYENAFEWRFEFPEVLDDEGKYLGFDVVIGNPPYVSSKEFSKEVFNHLKTTFSTSQYQIDLYVAFMEQSIRLLKNYGVLSFITPNSWLKNMNFNLCREYILDNFSISKIIPNLDNVFEEASVDTLIVIGHRNEESGFLDVLKVLGHSFFLNHKVKQEVFRNNERYIFDVEVTSKMREIFEKIMARSIKLTDVSEISRGVNPYDSYRGQSKELIRNKEYHANYEKDETFVPELRGKHIKHFGYKWDEKHYIKYGDWLAAPRDPKFHKGSRFLMRQVLADYLFCTSISESIIIDQSIFIALPTNEEYSADYLNGVIGNKLITWYFKAKNNEFDRLFPKIKIGEFRELPVLKSSTANRNRIVSICQDIKSKVSLQNEYREDLFMLDLIVYKLYELTYEEVKIVDPDFEMTEQEYVDYNLEQ